MKLADVLVGHRVVAASMEDATLTLDNGVQLVFQKANDDCCSYIELSDLHTTNNIITAVEFGDDEDEPRRNKELGYEYAQGEGEYKAWLHVVTDGGEAKRIAEADGNASNGYYLHGFALDVTVVFPDGREVASKYWERS